MIAKSYTILCNHPVCLNRVVGGLCVDESQVLMNAFAQGWMFGSDRAHEHYCSQVCHDTDPVVVHRRAGRRRD